MIVDAEMGLPLDLSRWDALWDDAADDSGAFGVLSAVRIWWADVYAPAEMNPDPQRLPRLDPKDAFLMGDAGGAATFAGAGGSGFSAPVSSGPSTPAPAAFVPWLRKTEYISRESRSNATTNEPYVLQLLHIWGIT
jgi:RNA polymerase II-associated factor 1